MDLVKIDQSIPINIKESMLKLGFTKDQFYSEAHNALSIWNEPKNKYLRKADKQTFLDALINLCKVNLSLNPIKKEAYLVPRKNGERIDVCLEPSYIGLIKLLTDEGTVKHIQTNVVYDNDEYTEFYDMNGINFKHVPTKDTRGNIKGVYCIAFLSDGGKQFEYMTIQEVNSIKEKSESYKAFKDPNKKVFTCIWNDYESEMIRKTCLRRIYKYLPRSNSDQSKYIQEAIKLDESAFSATGEQIQQIENLLHTSMLPESEKTQIETEFTTMTSADANRCINYLNMNQKPETEYENPGSEDIQNIVQQKIDLDK